MVLFQFEVNLSALVAHAGVLRKNRNKTIKNTAGTKIRVRYNNPFIVMQKKKREKKRIQYIVQYLYNKQSARIHVNVVPGLPNSVRYA